MMPHVKINNPLHDKTRTIELISQVTGEPAETVARRLELEFHKPGSNVADDFARCGGPRYVWGPHLLEFYSATNAFIYELLVWNRNTHKRRARRWTMRHMAAASARPLEILSVGDGLGFDCLHFAARGHRMTYFELPGISERFARRLFQASGADIPVLTDPASIPRESFDAITCFDVLEHVPDPPAMVRDLASYLRPGGILYVSAPFYMLLRWYPTHLRSNRRYSGSLKLYEQAGFKLVDGAFTWYPLVLQKPPVSLKPRSNFSVRFSGMLQAMGRVTVLPFYPVHFIRRMGNCET